MWREPTSYLRRVALAGVDIYLIIGVFAVAVDDVFAGKCVVIFKRFVRPKAVSIDSHRLLLTVGKQESNCRFACGFRWDHVPFSSPEISKNEHGGLSPSYVPRPRVESPRERDPADCMPPR